MTTMSIENMYMQTNIKLDALHDLVLEFKKDVDRRFGETDRRFEGIDQRFEAMDHKFEAMDHKFEAMDHKFEAMDYKFDAMDYKFDEFRKEVKQDFAAMDTKINKNTELLNELYRRGDKIELSFSRKVLLGNGVFAGLVAFFTALITGRMMIET